MYSISLHLAPHLGTSAGAHDPRAYMRSPALTSHAGTAATGTAAASVAGDAGGDRGGHTGAGRGGAGQQPVHAALPGADGMSTHVVRASVEEAARAALSGTRCATTCEYLARVCELLLPTPKQVAALHKTQNWLQQRVRSHVRQYFVECIRDGKPCIAEWVLAARDARCARGMSLDDAIQESAEECFSVHFFGSSMYDLSPRVTDYDMVVVVHESMRHGIEPVRLLNDLSRVVRRAGRAGRLFLVKRARVPVLEAMLYAPDRSAHQVDIIASNWFGVHNTAMLRFYMQLDARLRPLILGVKLWTKVKELSDASKAYLASYSYLLMVLFYCQLLHIVPSLQSPELRALEEELGCGDAWHRLGLPPVASSSHAMGWVSTPAAVAEWKRRSSGADGMYPVHLIALESLRTASPEIDALLAPRTSAHHARSVEELNASVLVPCALINALNVGQLMVGFFTLFGELLEWSLTSISVRTASFTSRPIAGTLPHAGLSIEDPFELDRDLGRVCQKHETVKAFVADAAALLAHCSEVAVPSTPPPAAALPHAGAAAAAVATAAGVGSYMDDAYSFLLHLFTPDLSANRSAKARARPKKKKVKPAVTGTAASTTAGAMPTHPEEGEVIDLVSEDEELEAEAEAETEVEAE